MLIDDDAYERIEFWKNQFDESIMDALCGTEIVTAQDVDQPVVQVLNSAMQRPEQSDLVAAGKRR